MIGYNTLYKSMNGVKVLTDGISFISDGNAQHNNITYDDYIQSGDNKTKIINNGITTENITCNSLTSSTLSTSSITSTNLTSEYIYGNYFLIKDTSGNNMFIIDGLNTKTILSYNPIYLYNTLNLVNYNLVQTQTGIISQGGTGENYLKDTYINGYLNIGSDITQLGGSTSLLTLTCDTITQRADKGIIQSGNVINSLGGTTTTKNLIITDSLTLPANVQMPSFSTSDDIIMNGTSVIIQDITTTTTNRNIFRDTQTQNLYVNGNILMNMGGTTATLKDTTIQGTSTLQGDITQTAGACIFKTINCNNITLNDDQNITQSGAGYITQSGSGTNTFKAINLLSNANLTFNGTGIISQALNGINILSHLRSAGYCIIGGRNNTTYSNYQNCQNNNGIQFQFNRDNTNQYSFILTNRSSGGNGGFRFQRYIAGVYADEPLVIDDNITMYKNLSIPAGSLSCSSATIGNITQDELNCLDSCNQNINNKFTSLDSQISNINSEITTLNNSSTTNSLALTGMSYNGTSDTTTIDNNVNITKNLTTSNYTSLCNNSFAANANFIFANKSMNFYANLIVYDTSTNGHGTTVMYRDINTLNYFFDSYYYNYGTGGGFVFRCKTPDGTNNYLDVMNIQKTGISIITPLTLSDNLIANNDFICNGNSTLNNLTVNNNSTFNGPSTFNNDINITGTNKLYIGTMDVAQEIINLDTSFTTGTINSTDLNTTNITASSITTNTIGAYIGNITNINTTDIGTTTLRVSNDITTNIIRASSVQIGSMNSMNFTNISSSMVCPTPISEYNVLKVDNINVTFQLPSANGLQVVTNFFTVANNSTCTILPATGEYIYDLNFNTLSSVILGNNNYITLQLITKNNKWYIVNGYNSTLKSLNVYGSTTLNTLAVNGTTTLNNNVYMNNAFNIYQMVGIDPNYSYSKTLGASNVLVSTITVSPLYNQRIIVNSPISVYRNGTNSSGGNQTRHYETLSSITAYYTKNDIFVDNLIVSTNNTLPSTKQYNHISPSFGYEQYFTNATCDFLPSLEISNTAIYKVYFTFTYSYSVNYPDATGTVSGYYVNTNISDTYTYGAATIFFITSSGTNYSSTSFTTSPFDVNYMDTNNNSQLQINNLISNNISNQSKIKTNTLTCDTSLITPSLTSTNISSTNISTIGLTSTYLNLNRSKALLPGYMYNGGTILQAYPITCSLKGIDPNNNDDVWYVNPGYKFLIYDGLTYTGSLLDTFENNTSSPMTFVPTNPNSASSVKVYYRNVDTDAYVEITMAYLSS